MTDAGRNFGSRFREIRIESSKRLSDVADILGVSTAYVSEMENDLRGPVSNSTIEKLLKILERLDASEELKLLAAIRRGTVQLSVRGLPEETVARIVEFGNLAAAGLTDAQWKAILTIARQT